MTATEQRFGPARVVVVGLDPGSYCDVVVTSDGQSRAVDHGASVHVRIAAPA